MKGFKKMETDIKKPVGQVHWLFPVPLAYKLIYYGNGIIYCDPNYKLHNSAFLLFHNPI